jgi:hypothetical protein
MARKSEFRQVQPVAEKHEQPDDKVPEFSAVEAEFADAIIRMMDQAHARGWRVAQAIEAKMKFNATRAHKHGKAF